MSHPIIERLQQALKPWRPPEPKSKPKLNGQTAVVRTDRMRRYAEAALEGEVRNLSVAPQGGRNNAVFLAGCKLGKYVHHGILSLDEVESALLDASSSNGLIREDGMKACKATVASGMRKSEGDELPDLDEYVDERVKPNRRLEGGKSHAEAVDIKAWPIMESKATYGVPFPKPMPAEDVEELGRELACVINLAPSRPGELLLSNSAQHYWASVYSELTRDWPGILGAVTSRQEAHARRLALTYAQLDGAERIEIDHLEAALAFCRYAFDSAVYLFGETELDPTAQKILDALASGSKTQSQIIDLFQRNVPAKQLAAVLEELQERGRITLTKEATGERGRPRSVWSLNEKNEANEDKWS